MKVFLDSSIIITGIHSKTSASWIILQLSQKRKVKAFVSSMILNEVVRNLNKKFPQNLLQEFLQYLPESKFKKIEFKSELDISKFQGITNQKDIHVLAAASKAKVDYLITLDKKHLLSLREPLLPFTIITPGDLIKKITSESQVI